MIHTNTNNVYKNQQIYANPFMKNNVRIASELQVLNRENQY